MKILVLLSAALFLSTGIYSQSIHPVEADSEKLLQKDVSGISKDHVERDGSLSSQPFVIDPFDTVFFDLGQAVVNGNQVEFPVYFRSDDVINALDFAFKYDHSHLDYDTILNLTNYIQPLSFYNTIDSTVRLTSYSFSQPYSNDTPLVKVVFTVLSGQLCSGDLSSVSGLLNGDAASYMVVECQTSGMDEEFSMGGFNVFPNPATHTIIVNSKVRGKLTIYNVLSEKVLAIPMEDVKEEETIEVSDWPAGNYTIRFESGTNSYVKKILIVR